MTSGVSALGLEAGMTVAAGAVGGPVVLGGIIVGGCAGVAYGAYKLGSWIKDKWNEPSYK